MDMSMSITILPVLRAAKTNVRHINNDQQPTTFAFFCNVPKNSGKREIGYILTQACFQVDVFLGNDLVTV